jgi:hypothetical protein
MRAVDAAQSILLWMTATGLWAFLLGWFVGVPGNVAAAAIVGAVIRALVIIAEEG